MEIQRLLGRCDSAASELADRLIGTSLAIHSRPEVAFQEKEAASLLTGFLEDEGFSVERGVADMETAFVGRWRGGEGPTIAFVAEYDALPEVGHACGHNIIGTAAVGAAAALKRACRDLPGQLVVMGTPAEEGGGGKILMIQAGLFRGVDAALMIHPATGSSKIGGTSLATSDLVISFRGRPAHASGSPHLGINALDAVVQTYVNVSMLRQHVSPDVRMHCLITKGGPVINVVPEEAEIRYLLRAATRKGVDHVAKRVRECAEGAAAGTRATVSFVERTGYDERWPNRVLGDAFRRHFERLEVLMPADPEPSGGSTDFGNVSKVVPASNAYVSIGPKSVAGHSREFAACAASEQGHHALISSVKAMAGLAGELLLEPQLLIEARAEFENRCARDSEVGSA